MIDFMLDNNGDLSFKTLELSDTGLQLDFFVSDNSTLFFDFYIENNKNFSYIKNLMPGLVLHFTVDEIKYNKEIICNLTEEDYLFQQLKIRINSSLNTIVGNEDIGSDIEFYRHKNINDNIDLILKSVKDAINDIMPDADISIERINEGYFDYTNKLQITISNEEYSFYYYL